MANKKSRGWARTGHKRSYQKRFSEKKIGLVTKTTRRSEVELSKQKDEELFDDGGMPSGVSLSLNKKSRWMIPEIVEEEMAERFLQNHHNDGEIKSQERKSISRSSRRKKRKPQNHDDELPLKSVVIERNLMSHRSICKAVYSATSEECKIKKGKSWKCQLSALMEDPANGFDILYEIESGTPSETWPFNCESSFTAHNSLFRKQLESKSFLCRGRQLEMKEALNEWYDSFENENNVDADEPYETDVDGYTEFENDDSDIVTLADFCISKKKTLKRKRPTASSKCSFHELKPCNPASTELVYLHGKNTMVYIEADGMAPPVVKEENNNNETQETPLDTKPLVNKKYANAIRDDGLEILTPKASNDISGFPLKDCQECKISVGTASVSEKQLFETYGNDYIESKSTPRKFAIILDQRLLDGESSTAARVKLENKGDLSFFAKQDDLGKKAKGYSKPITNKAKMGTNRNKETKAPAPSNKTVKQLLGELYADKAYLEKLMKDSDFINHEANQKVHDLVQDGISYLDTRTEFWRQQKPLYARKKDKPVKGRKIMTRDQVAMMKLSKFMKKLEDIDAALSEGLPGESLKLAEDTLKEVVDTSPSVITNRDEIISNLHSCIGNALLDLDKPQKALKHHTKDLDISNKNDHNDGKSRALDNIGRSYARIGNYQKAVDSWQEKLPLVKTPLESTWLRHEIGRCHLEMGNFAEARDYGEQALDAAKEAADEVWQLNSSVLIAQADVKLNDLDRALKSFDKSMDLANVLEDEAAQNAISKAVNDLKAQMNGGEKANSEDEEADDHRNSKDQDKKDEEKKSSPEPQGAEDGHENSDEEKHDSSEEVEQKESTEETNTEEQEKSNEKADVSDKEELAGAGEPSDNEKQDGSEPETA